MSFNFPLRSVLGLLLTALLLPACDNNSDLSDITVNVSVDGNGKGTIDAQTIGLNIECRTDAGVITGSCTDTFQDSDGGSIRLKGLPDAVTNFSWGGDCRTATGQLCELTYSKGEDVAFEVIAHFEAKTVRVLVTPKPIQMTEAGQTVIATAQAIDENDAEVFGVVYTWETSDAGVATVMPMANPRQATITAVASGSAIISASAQGFTGKTQVDITIKN